MLDIRQLRSDPQGVAGQSRAPRLCARPRRIHRPRGTPQGGAGGGRRAAQRTQHALEGDRHAKGKGEDVAPLLAEVESLGGRLAEGEQALATLQGELDRLLLDLPNLAPRQRAGRPRCVRERRGAPARRAAEARVRSRGSRGDRGRASADSIRPRPAALSGARFAVLTGPVASLHRALAQFMLDLHLREHGYREAWVPYLVSRKTLTGTGQLPKFEQDLFKLAARARGERAVPDPDGGSAADESRRRPHLRAGGAAAALVAHTPCFRSEAGSYGKDTRGLIRQHQFDKVELVQIVRPDGLVRGARGADGPRRAGAGAARAAVPRHGALRGRHRLREREDLRPRGLAAGAGRLSRDFLLQQLRGLPGAAHAGALAQSRDRQAGAGAHAEWIGCRRRAGARRRARERPAGATAASTVPAVLRPYLGGVERLKPA